MHRFRLLGLVGMLVVGLTACSTSQDTKNDRSAETQREIEEANDAYLEALTTQVAAVAWPTGYTPVVARIHQRSTAGDIFIPDPQQYAASAIRFFQHCAWSMAWLDAYTNGDAGLMDSSLDVLLDPALYAETNPESREHLLGLARSAGLGDPTGLQNVVDQNCLPADWIEES